MQSCAIVTHLHFLGNLEGTVEGTRNRTQRDVIVRGPKPSAANHDIVSGPELPKLALYLAQFVRHQHHTAQLGAGARQLLGRLVRVRVSHLSFEDLVTDDKHAHSLGDF